MHELSVTQGILNITTEEANKHNAQKVTKVKIKMGILSDLLPECINYYFDILSKGSIAEGATIEVEKLPLKVKCFSCSKISQIDIKSFRCPCCGSQDLKIITGNEFYIDSIEIE